MTRVADHVKRRNQVAEAVLRVTAANGLTGVSVAKVAAAAQVSVGLVQHYFPTKDAMLLFAFEHISEQFAVRVAATPQQGTTRQRLSRTLAELLPLDEERAAEVRIWLAFCAQAAVTPQLAAVQAGYLAEMRTHLAAAIRFAQEIGEASQGLDPENEGIMLAAFIDGLANQAHNDPTGLPRAVIEGAVEAYLDRIFTRSKR